MAEEKKQLSARLKALRELRGWSVTETARRAQLSVSMLWKVENGQTELTYSKLARLAAGLEVPVGELFADPGVAIRKGGRRVINRQGSGSTIEVESNLHHFLASDLAKKHFFPCVIDVCATSGGLEDGEPHGGEEFAIVTAGRVKFFCEGYEPVVLDIGDSVYFDACMRHRYIAAEGDRAQVVCIYSHPEHARLDQGSEAEPHSRALRALTTAEADPDRKTKVG